ncbi:MAG: hypothetical protein J6S08_01605 [Duodenibacillus sp.]|nr:hypothetical protein [Duodenibacillus sp.]
MFKPHLVALAILSAFAVAPVGAAQFGQAPAAETAAVAVQEQADTAQEAQENAQVINSAQAAAQKAPTIDEVRDADTLASDFIKSLIDDGTLEAGLGWNDERETYVVKSVAQYEVKDLTDPNFIRIRSMKAIEAGLNAKRDIIQFIRTELSVENLLTLPETGLTTEFDQQKAKIQRLIEAKSKEYAKLLKEIDAEKAATFAGIDLNMVLRQGMSVALQRIGSVINLEKLDADKRARIEKLNADLTAMQTQIDSLKAEAERLRNAVLQESTSSTETFAAMPLSGVFTMAQFESYKDGVYQVSLVSTWSPKQEAFVRDLFAKNETRAPMKGAMTMGQYINNTDWSNAVGTRKFLDKRGVLSIVAIGSWPIAGNGSAARRTAEGMAVSMAQNQLAVALHGDVKSQEMARVKTQEIKGEMGKNETQVVENFAEQLSETVKNMPLQGVQRRLLSPMTHGLSGQKMMVAVLSVSVNDAKVAAMMEKSSYDSAKAIESSAARSKGMKQGYEDGLNAVRRDKTQFEQGRADAMGVKKQVQQKVDAVRQQTGAKPAAPSNKSVQGGGSSRDAFFY